MVNKVALGILAVIILTAMTVGGLVGLQLSGDGSPGEATPTSTPTPTPTATPGTPGANATANGTADGGADAPTPTSTPAHTVSPPQYDENLIEQEVRAGINVRRDERGMDRLIGDEPVDRMALNHSRAMARLGYVTHDAGGFTTAERYEAFGLADRCRIPDNSDRGIRTGRELETVDKKKIGQNYTFQTDGRTEPLENETQVARATVDAWFADRTQRQKLLLEDARVAGVGAAVTPKGDVYVTVDLC
ncbi:MAG: CAP domain-containing protein [Haloarculaceae archaeon]